MARAAFPRGHRYLQVYDALGPPFASPDLAALYPGDGQPAAGPAPPALVTIVQFVEGLSARPAADAVRGRLAWKYAPCLPPEGEGFAAAVLSAFRARLVAGGAGRRIFETVPERLGAHRLGKPRGRPRTGATPVLAAIPVRSRLACLGAMPRHALATLARVAPAWRRARVPADWFGRCGRRFREYRSPAGKAARTALAEEIGAGGRPLLPASHAPAAPAW